jgi:hypothetical protein
MGDYKAHHVVAESVLADNKHMSTDLCITADQIHAAQSGQPVRLADPQTNHEFVLIRADIYDKVRTVLDDGLDDIQVAKLIEANMREYDEADPLLPLYGNSE